MVFDMTDNESRKSLHAVKDWNDELHQHTSEVDIPVILAGNKVKTSKFCVLNVWHDSSVKGRQLARE